METTRDPRIDGIIIRAIGFVMSLAWAFDFLFGVHLPFYFGMVSVGIFAYGHNLLKKAETKKEDETPEKN